MGSIGYPGPRGVKVSAVVDTQNHSAMKNFHFSLKLIQALFFSTFSRVPRESEALKVTKEKR